MKVEQVIGCTSEGEIGGEEPQEPFGQVLGGYTINWTNSPQTNQSIISSITPYGSDGSDPARHHIRVPGLRRRF